MRRMRESGPSEQPLEGDVEIKSAIDSPPPGARSPKQSYLRVAESIRVRILQGELKPGDRLPRENDFAHEEGVGRTTVREALRLLASASLIEIRRGVHGGAFVTSPKAEGFMEIMLTALSLMAMHGELTDGEIMEATFYTMPTTARMAAERRTDEEAAALVDYAASLSEVRTDDEWVSVGWSFNRLLVQTTRNRLLAMFLNPLMAVASTRNKERRLASGWREATAVRYQELADAIRRHAPAAAEEAMLRLRERYQPLK